MSAPTVIQHVVKGDNVLILVSYMERGLFSVAMQHYTVDSFGSTFLQEESIWSTEQKGQSAFNAKLSQVSA